MDAFKTAIVLSENPTIDEVRTYFAEDKFATEVTGCEIVEGTKGRSVCTLTIQPHHRNAMGNVMGGAIFTLADFALAVASCVGEKPTVTVDANIRYLAQPKGEQLVAVCTADKSGRSAGFYTTRVEDESGTLVAIATATCYR